MAQFTFTKATKKQAKARVALDGPSGAGKTYTALMLAEELAQGGKVAVIDTERGSASLYSDKFSFDVLELQTFSPAVYAAAIKAAEEAGYSVIVIDSLTHAWEGEGGALEQVDNIAARSQSKNTYFAWRDVTPLHRKMVDAILQSPCHVVATMRSKTEYIIETDARGKQVPRKIGTAPIQRAGMEYEFTLVADLDIDHKLVVSKSRCDAMADKVILKPGAEFWKPFVTWLNSGEAAEPKPAQPDAKPAAQDDKPMNGHPRPYPPAILKEKILEHADQLSDGALRGTEAQTIASNLNACFGGDDAKRKVLLKYLTGHDSVKELDAGWLLALKKWIRVTQDPQTQKWNMDALAMQEAQAAYTHALVEAGQLQLPEAQA